MSAIDYTGRILLRLKEAKPMPNIDANANLPGSFGNKAGVNFFAVT
jgi:hypothetical protein